MRFLSEHISPEQMLPCRIRGVEEALKGSNGFMFLIANTSFFPSPFGVMMLGKMRSASMYTTWVTELWHP